MASLLLQRQGYAAVSVLAFFVAAIGAAEGILVSGNVAVGSAAHAGLIGLILLWRALRPGDPLARVLPVLILPPMLRLLSLSIPDPSLPVAAWLGLIGLPLMVAALGLGWEVGLRPNASPWRSGGLWNQAGVAACGIPLGLLAIALALPRTPTLGEGIGPLVATLILAVFAGAVEEIVFRGVVQPALAKAAGVAPAIGLTAVTSAVMYLGSGPAAAILALALGLIYGVIVAKTGSVVGVAISHGVLIATVILIG